MSEHLKTLMRTLFSYLPAARSQLGPRSHGPTNGGMEPPLRSPGPPVRDLNAPEIRVRGSWLTPKAVSLASAGLARALAQSLSSTLTERRALASPRSAAHDATVLRSARCTSLLSRYLYVHSL